MPKITRPDRAARDEAICRDYRAGKTQKEIADKLGLTKQAVSAILKKHGARLSEVEWRKRNADATKANWQDPEFRKRNADATKAAKAVWPDCPEHLKADYATLRAYMSAREARASLDPGYSHGPAYTGKYA